MKTPIKRPAPGFTLMEMLVVISIIVVLTALTIGGLNFAQDSQARKKAEVQIQLLQLALQDYHSEKGGFPESPNPNGENNTDRIYDALFPIQEDEKVYLDQLDPGNDNQGWLNGQQPGNALKIFDPWKKEFYYRANDPANPEAVTAVNPDFDLWSAGPDGKTEPGNSGDYDPKHPDNRDDIRGW